VISNQKIDPKSPLSDGRMIKKGLREKNYGQVKNFAVVIQPDE
jgi:hypothetical protein